MKWLFRSPACRPVVLVEDHGHHIDRFLRKIRRDTRPEALGRLTVVYVAKDGDDTALASVRWLLEHPSLQIVAPGDAVRELAERTDAALRGGREPPPELAELLAPDRDTPPAPVSSRLLPLPPEALSDAEAYGELLQGLLRPNGLLVTDVQLEPVSFAGDDAFATLRAASRACAAVAGGNGQAADVALWVMSNRTFFELNAHAQLRELGIQHQVVTSKRRGDEERLCSLIAERLGQYPWLLLASNPGTERVDPRTGRVAPETLAVHGGWMGPADRELISNAFDVVLWPEQNGGVAITGQAILPGTSVSSKPRIELWRELIEDRLLEHEGISAEEVLALIGNGSSTAAHLIAAVRERFIPAVASRHLPAANGGRYMLGAGTRVAQVVAEHDRRALRRLRAS